MPSKRRVLSSDSEDSDDEDARYHKRIAANKEASRQGDRKEAARQKIRNQYFGPVAPAGSSLGGGFVRTNAGPEWKAPLKAQRARPVQQQQQQQKKKEAEPPPAKHEEAELGSRHNAYDFTAAAGSKHNAYDFTKDNDVVDLTRD